MSRDTRFYSNLPYHIATQRLQQVAIKGVHITVHQPEHDHTKFRLDLQQQTPIGTFTSAQLQGNIQPIRDDQIQIAYRTRAYTPRLMVLILISGIGSSILLLAALPSSMAPIISAPGVAAILLVLFWSTLGSDIRSNDRTQLERLLERVLEKQTSMMTWQA